MEVDNVTMKKVGIVGYGSFGSFAHTLFTVLIPQTQVKVYSSRHEPDGVNFFSFEEVCSCDALMLAVPIRAYEEVIEKIAQHIQPDTVVLDIASVKKTTIEALKRHIPDQPYIAVHPMFGPQSYERHGHKVRGLKLVVCDYTIDKETYQITKEYLENFGLNIIEMSADEHDKKLAESLFLTHFIASLINTAGFKRTDIDTPNFELLMDATDSVRYDVDLFKDVYNHDPYCEEVMDKIIAARKKMQREILDISDEA